MANILFIVGNNIIKILLISVLLSACNNVVRVNELENQDSKLILESDLEESVNYNGIKSCEEGEELAKKEIEKGKIKYIFGGYGSRQELPARLKEEYGIEVITVDGILGVPNKCYNDVMYKRIQEKFGKDAFNRAMQ